MTAEKKNLILITSLILASVPRLAASGIYEGLILSLPKEDSDDEIQFTSRLTWDSLELSCAAVEDECAIKCRTSSGEEAIADTDSGAAKPLFQKLMKTLKSAMDIAKGKKDKESADNEDNDLCEKFCESLLKDFSTVKYLECESVEPEDIDRKNQKIIKKLTKEAKELMEE